MGHNAMSSGQNSLMPVTGQGTNMQLANGNLPSYQENNNYHFRFKISLVGDSGVGKSTFLDAISQTLGTVVENEESSELHIKVSSLFS